MPHNTNISPFFCNSFRLHFVETFRAIRKIYLFPKVSRYVLTLRSRTTPHRYTERQESNCTRVRVYTTDTTFCAIPLHYGQVMNFPSLPKLRHKLHETPSRSRLFHIAYLYVSIMYVTVPETFGLHTAYEGRTDSLHKLIRQTSVCLSVCLSR